VWRGAGGVDSRMCCRTAVGGSDGQSYNYTLTEDTHAVAYIVQVQCANDFRVAAICHSSQKLAHACLRHFQHTAYPGRWTGVMWWPNNIFLCGRYKNASSTLIALYSRQRQYVQPIYLYQPIFHMTSQQRLFFNLNIIFISQFPKGN
jgi:hypothetical protein